MAYRPPYDSIDELNVRNSLEVDIAYNADERAEVLARIEGLKERQQRYLENGNTFTANNVQKTIDSQTAYAARLQEQIDGSTADLAVVDQRQTPQQTDTAQNELENNPPSDNNPEAETLPLEEEAAIEETVLEEGDEGEVLPEPSPEEETEDLPPLQEEQTSSTNEELATTNEDSADGATESTVESEAKEVYVEYPNVLHNYPSYTYGISLNLMTSDEWNQFTITGDYQARNVIIASAGKFDQTVGPNKLIRNKYFNEDFYFEELRFESYMAPTDRNPNTNALKVDMTIVEPYGVSLMNRLIDATKELESSEKSPNYLDNIYMMQIDFYAQSEDGTILNPIPGITKHIPIKIISLEFTVGTEGSKYTLGAIPYQHSAFDMATQTTPLHLEIVAGTVEDFFSFNGTETLDKEIEEAREKETEDLATYYGGVNTAIVNKALLSKVKFADQQIYKVKGYASAYNAYQEGLKKQKDIKYVDTIRFKFDDEIGKARIVEQQKISTKDTPMASDNQTQSDQRRAWIASQSSPNKTTYFDKSTRKYAINAGTSIEAILDDVITNSTYILDQIVDPSDFTDPKLYEEALERLKDQPFKWFKVIPEVKIEKFDSITNRMSRTITYHVRVYKIYNNKLSFMPGGKAEIPLKVYKYIYTGENKDIMSFDIKFNASYYTSVTSYASKLTRTENILKNTDEKNAKVEGYETNSPWTIQPKMIRPQILDSQKTATGGGITSKQMAAADATKSLLTESQGDMINVQLQIIGDPLFIKQDDVFYQKQMEKSKFKNNKITPNGSFITDGGETYIQLEWKTPVDIDQSTGLVKYEERYQNSLFNGMYKVIMVENTFRDGMFTQNLDCIRLWDQERFDYTIPKKTNSKEERKDTDKLSDGYDPTQTDNGVPTTVDADNVAQTAATEQLTNEVAADSAPQDDQIEEDAGDTEARKETDILSQINNQEATPIGTQNEPAVNSPEGLLAAEDEWINRNLKNQIKQDDVTAQLREANRDYTTATQAYNIYGAAAFNQDPTLRGRLEKAVEDRQRLTAELNKLEQEKTAIDANKPF